MGTEQHKSLHVIEINHMDVMKKDIPRVRQPDVSGFWSYLMKGN
jgi:hypothetical protein